MVAVDVVRSALERVPHGRPSRPFDETDEDVARFCDAIVKRMTSGDLMRAWTDIDHRFVRLYDANVSTATRELVSSDLPSLLRLLSSANTLAAHAIGQLVPWSDDLGERWVSAPEASRPIAALGVVMWLRPLRGMPVDSARELISRVAMALARRPREDEVSIWWQIVGVAFRHAPMLEHTVHATVDLLYRFASEAIGRAGHADALPSGDEWRVYKVGNPALAGLLPLIANRTEEESYQRVLLEAFYADVDARMAEKFYGLLSSQVELLYINMCGVAVALDAFHSIASPWWQKKLTHYIGCMSGWKADRTNTSLDRASWIACAVAIGAIQLKKDRPENARHLLSALMTQIEPCLPTWLWDEYEQAGATRTELPRVLAKALKVDPAKAGTRALMLAGEVHDGLSLKTILAETSELLSETDRAVVEQLREARDAYERELARGLHARS